MERVSDYIIRKINEAGINHVFFIAGRGILYLTDALAKNKNVIPIATYHEQGASYAAMAYSSSNNNLGACLVSTGCAATNAVTACLCAYQDSIPMIFISGNNPLKENVRYTGIKIRTYGSQEADIINIVRPITKYAVMLEDVNTVVYEVEKALYLAREGRKGPVWIDVPLDVQNMHMNENCYQVKYRNVCDNDNCCSIDASINEVTGELNKANHPILLIGGGARNAKRELEKLVTQYNIPCVSSPAGCDIYGSGYKFSIGTVGSIGGSRSGNFAVQNSDYILVLGSRLSSQLTGVRENFGRHAKVVVVDVDEIEHTKSEIVDKLIVCDAKIFLRKLLECGLKKRHEEWLHKCLHWKKLFAIHKEQFVQDLIDKNKIDIYTLVDSIFEIVSSNATIITDAGFEELIVPSAGRFRENQRCLFPAAQGAMGYAIPAIIGAYAAGRKNIICIVGDGSILMNMQELQIISKMKIPAKIVVVNNNMYAVIRKRQQDLFRQRTIGNDPSDGVPTADFSRIAFCFDIKYRHIEYRSELIEYLNDMAADQLELVEVISVPEQIYIHESYAFNEKKKLVHRPIEDMAPFLPRSVIKAEMLVPLMEE
ncbi:acetolactate synthase-1/2/3 large subunit [Selenomonas sp. WCT3]|uniref:thiamine pyrophosphate-binding protein n=1 Tax=Selenomonas sp. WCT3 TaxID=3158785 RepID=UPI00088AC8E6|nr:acetolactate synthase-1/2/3 large subunit [Selenomonas ruminantium]